MQLSSEIRFHLYSPCYVGSMPAAEVHPQAADRRNTEVSHEYVE
jgi:hypothetical protein